MAIQLMAAEKHWKAILALAGLIAGGVIGGMLYLQEKQAADPASATAAVSTEQAEAAESAAQEPAAAPQVQPIEINPKQYGPFAEDIGYYFHKGFYMTDSGICSRAMGHNFQEIVNEIEAAEGRRVRDARGFSQGMIIEFWDGTSVSVWSREIDCKDPPYDPLKE